MNEKIMVSVIMITYKHESYIAEAIEGVLKQECDFEVELIIADDCSPDSTEQIVKEIINNHPNGHWIRYTRHQTNLGMIANLIWVLKQSKGKYIAMCEGDDYWIDILKLQKQVNYLEKNRHCVYSFTNNNILFPDKSVFSKFSDKSIPEESDLHKLLSLNLMPGTQTVLFRSDSLPKQLPNWFNKVFQGDWILLFIICSKGSIHYLNDTTAVYRQGLGVSSNTKDFIMFKKGLNANKKLNQYTHFKYDYHIGNYLFHHKMITYSYLENHQSMNGLIWFIRTNIYLIFSRKNSWSQSDMFLFYKSVIKLFFRLKK